MARIDVVTRRTYLAVHLLLMRLPAMRLLTKYLLAMRSRITCFLTLRSPTKLPSMPCFLVSFLGLALLGSAFGSIGEPPQDLLADVADYEPRQTGEDRFQAVDGVDFRLETRGGLVFSVSGEGDLTGKNRAFMADLIAAGTGYGSSIAGPVGRFLSERTSELSGRGEVSVGVEEYRLSLDVSGTGEPYRLRFSLELQEVSTDLFPPARHKLGPDDARYVVREFSDFQCPFCANFAGRGLPMIEQRLLDRGDVRFEYHHFPLNSIHPNATPAAVAAECVTEANSPADFWAFHDALFERQRAWQGLGEPQPYFLDLAREIGLSTDGVRQCLDDGDHEAFVEQSSQVAGGVLRITGTPTVFVNGYKVADFLDPQAYVELIEMIDAFSTGR